MRKRGHFCHPADARPSVSPSVTLVYRIYTAEDIVELLSVILVFDPRRRVPNSKGNPFSRGAKYIVMPEQHRYLANKCEDIVNLQGRIEALCRHAHSLLTWPRKMCYAK